MAPAGNKTKHGSPPSALPAVSSCSLRLFHGTPHATPPHPRPLPRAGGGLRIWGGSRSGIPLLRKVRLQTSSRFQAFWVSGRGSSPGGGASSAGPRLGLRSAVPADTVRLVCGVACPWSDVLGAGEPRTRSRVRAVLRSTPRGLDPSAPTGPGRPPWPGWGGTGACHRGPGAAGCAQKLRSRLSALAEPGPHGEGVCQQGQRRRQAIGIRPTRKPSSGGKGGEE